MDDRSKGLLYIAALVLTLVSSLGRAQTLEYISPEKRQSLKKQFEEGHFSRTDVRKVQLSSTWTCDMYGVRSALQVKHGVELYEWSIPNAASEKITNSGLQVVSEYQFKNSTLSGNVGAISDELRFTKSGQLISRLSHSEGPSSKVIAYALCTPSHTTRL
jgi:hypothetical protein